MTFNSNRVEIQKLIDRVARLHPTIQINYTISKRISFLDVQIENTDCGLVTSVHHKQSCEPYVVPFSSDHPRHVFENIIQGSLVRAIRYSSTLTLFQPELRWIRLKLFLNGESVVIAIHMKHSIVLHFPRYPVRYADHHQKHYFTQCGVLGLSILLTAHDDHEFQSIRRDLLNQPTIAEHGRPKRIVSQITPNASILSNDQLVQAKHHSKQEKRKSINVDYHHESHLTSLKSALQKTWKMHFTATDIQQTRLIVGTRNNQNLAIEFNISARERRSTSPDNLQQTTHEKDTHLFSTKTNKYEKLESL